MSPRFSPAAFETALVWVAAVLYAFAVAAVFLNRRRAGGWLDHLPGLLGFLLHGGAIVLATWSLGRLPIANLKESAEFLAFLLAGSYLVAALGFRFFAVEALLLALAAAFLGLSFLLPGAVEAPQSRWFVFHTLLSFLGVTALFAACVVSILYLLADRQLKRKRPGSWLGFLPSLVACDRAASRLLALGFPLLSLGILAGMLWGHEKVSFSPGPKEALALVAWAIYAVLMVARFAAGWRGRKAAILSVTAAVAAVGAVLSIRL